MFSAIISYFKPAPAIERITDLKLLTRSYRKWRVRAFLGAYIGYMGYYVTRQAISPVAHLFKSANHLTDHQYGLLISSALLAYGICKFFSGMLADRGDIRKLFAFGLLFSSSINLFFGYISSFAWLLFFWTVSQMLQTIGSAACTRVFVYWFSPRERTRTWLLWDSSQTLGTMIIALLAGIILSLSKVFPWLDWRWVFIASGIWGIATSFYILLSMADTPVSVGLSPIEEYMHMRHLVICPKKEKGNYWKILCKYVLSNKYIWVLCLANFFSYFGKYVIFSWSAVFLESRFLDVATIPFIFTINPLLGSFGAITAGFVSHYLFDGECLPVGVLSFAGFAICSYLFYLYAGTQHIWITCICIGLLGFFGAAISGLLAVAVSFLTVKESAAAANGLFGIVGYAGGFFAGIGAATIKMLWNWDGVFFACVMGCMVGILLVLLVHQNVYRR